MTVDEIVAAMQAIIDQATAPAADAPADAPVSASLTEEQAQRYEQLEKQLHIARKSEEIVKRQAAYKSVAAPIVTFGGSRETDELSRAFDSYLRTGKPNSDLIARAQNESTGSAGGFLVPTTFQNKITEHLKAFGGLQSEAETVSTASGEPMYWLTNDDVLSNEAEITPESALWSTGADLSFGTRALGAYKYTTIGANTLPLKVSFELLQDSAFDIQSFIAKKFAERIARKVAVDLISGSGVNEPMGLISTMGGLTNSNITIASATAGPTYGELLSIIHSLDPAYRTGAKWLMNDATLAQIEGLVDTTGRPLVWNSNQDLSQGQNLTLLGYPVVIDQAMPNMLTGSTRGIVFGNLRDTYLVREVKGFTMVVLNELYAQNGQVGFMGWERLDGMVQDPFASVYVTSHS